MKHRDRHGRGMRGVIAAPNRLTGAPMPIPYRAVGVGFFADCLRASVARVVETCPRALVGVDIGFEDVPSLTEAWYDSVPLAAAVSARPEQPAQVVLYRRPIEHRATGRRDLARLIHRTIVEQLSALTGIQTSEIDPAADDWE
ncbi:MAG: metallopeptidase family protein [Actinobacteria bacterium]|nr:metallopeptidase family protein [Actinomycetota bacterium]